MYVGTQYFGTSKKEMEFLVRHGVTHFDATVDGYDVDTLTQHREAAAEHGVELEMVHIPFQDSIGLAAPDRDKAIDGVCGWIENAAKAAGFPIGPLALLDEVGIDIAAHAALSLHETYGERVD